MKSKLRGFLVAEERGKCIGRVAEEEGKEEEEDHRTKRRLSLRRRRWRVS